MNRLHKLALLMATRTSRRGLQLGVAAAVEHRQVPFEVPDLVLDVGAHTGQFALLARERFPNATIRCFEPHPTTFAQLEKTLAVVGNATAERCALGRTSGTSRLHVTRDTDSSSLLPVGSRQLDNFPRTREIDLIDVPIRRLDQCVDEAALGSNTLLKIDVQGSELEVLAGAGELLGRLAQVYVECSFVELYEGQALIEDVVGLLADAGLGCIGIFNVTSDHAGRPLQGDCLFAPRRSGERQRC